MKAENEKKGSVEVIMSCMHQDGFDIAYRTKINSDVLIVNQCDKDGYEEITVNGHLWRMIYTTERGSGKSRNMAIKNAKGDILLFCDDDEELTDNYSDIVLNAFEREPKAYGIVFNVERINLDEKQKHYRITKYRKAPSYRGYGWPMVAIKRLPIIENGIVADERFGSGSIWSCGEDSLFEIDMIKKKLWIYENPATIASIDYSGGSQWFFGMNEKFFYDKGAFIERVYRSSISKLLRIYYRAFRTRGDKTLSFSEKVKWIKNGMKGYRKNLSYKEFIENK